MSYDHWKTTEPPDDTPWQECASCHCRAAEKSMWLDDGKWFCNDCIVDELDDVIALTGFSRRKEA